MDDKSRVVLGFRPRTVSGWWFWWRYWSPPAIWWLRLKQWWQR